MSPGEAVAAGASYLVVGRPIIAAPDARRAAGRIVEEMRGALLTESAGSAPRKVTSP
jgi:orotidine-5'-phosphate decarboxylase